MRPLALAALVFLSGACASTQEARFVEDKGASAAARAQDTGSCRPFFKEPSLWMDEADVPRHSCWHRLWEIPAAMVAVPLFIGVVTAPVWAPIILL
jgi:hypothetical protein